MNADIVAEITKLVMERLGKEEMSSTSLTNSEIKRWNEISRSIKRSSGKKVEIQSAHTPLTSEELRNWNSISEKNSKRQPLDMNSDNVRFHTQY